MGIVDCVMKYLILIVCGSLIFLVKADTEDCNIIGKLEWTLGNHGFHRLIRYNFVLTTNYTWSGCRIFINQRVPNSLYVNKDQLHDLRRQKQLTTLVADFVDIEMPQDVSEPLNVYILSLLNSTSDNNDLSAQIDLPIHMRYHPPQPGGGFQSAIIMSPDVYFSCYQLETPKNCTLNDTTPTYFPCSLDGINTSETCPYYNLAYTVEEDSLEMLIPVGNFDHYDTVILVTYFVTIAGTIYLYVVILLCLPKT